MIEVKVRNNNVEKAIRQLKKKVMKDGLLKELKRLKNKKGPKFLHIITTKGKGLNQAEKDQVTYHAPGKFNAKTGELAPKSRTVFPPKYQEVFGSTIVELARKNKKIIGITPAMLSGSS